MADQLEILAATPVPPRERIVRTLADGEQVLERRVPIGVVGAIFEARPNVPIDLGSQVLTARSAVVMRTGAAAIGTSACLVDRTVSPALSEAGISPDAVQLMRLPGHGVADALLTQPDLIPLVVVRGSGEVTRRLSELGARSGVQVLSHADGGGVLYVDVAADVSLAEKLIRDSLDRLGVCNRLNLLLVHDDLPAEVVTQLEESLTDLGIAISRPPYTHPLGYEWALDSGSEATVTIARVAGPRAAAELADTETSGLAATICTTDPAAAEEFLNSYGGTSALWNTSTRLVDGFKMLGLPETGINVERTLGPRGPVTFPDLGMRQFVVVPAGVTLHAH
jgi:glutamate-5-semialdehyde dehydrogenase